LRKELSVSPISMTAEVKRDGPTQWGLGLMLLHPTDHAGYRRPIKHHSRLLAPILSDAATTSFFRISNFDELHISPMAQFAKRLAGAPR